MLILSKSRNSLEKRSVTFWILVSLPGRTTVIQRSIRDRSVAETHSATDTWIKVFQPWEPSEVNDRPVTRVVSVEATKLCEKWLKFRQSYSKDDRLDLKMPEPTFDSDLDTVDSLLKLLPEENKDVSIFTGTLNDVINIRRAQ
ncbi:uncharacterized protein G6M90_00g030820 [Metarhizium brunneum]|uniref:Uncharacterized protein n=1 Tax=Metarhizium brunneum TaxID=500148 RepID=A0A7D5Z3X7_9HYPO|nr:hypothetical protein G6M90_00g030820 [Metarhizium brunneum]